MPEQRKRQPTSPVPQISQLLFYSFFSPTSINHLTSTPFTRLLVIALLLISGVHPNPGPQGPIQSKTFMQFNCNGIQNFKAELQDFLINNNVKVAAIQETKLNSRSKQPSFKDYSLVRRDRPTGRGGGLAFLVHHSVRYTDIDTSSLIPQNDHVTELQGISVCVKDIQIKVYNIYIPPASANARFTPNISMLLAVDDDALILGDVNAHDAAWHSSLSDNRGESLADQIEVSNFYILNLASPTRCPPNGANSFPDVTLISSCLCRSHGQLAVCLTQITYPLEFLLTMMCLYRVLLVPMST
jgi:hypothetical protein